MPRDFYITKSLTQNKNIQAGTCLWRGLYARWNLVNQTHTLLDLSQVKQYRMGFDSTLPKFKSTQKLLEYRNLKFNLSYSTMLKDHIFYNFFFNHGTYNSTTNHSLLLWYPIYAQTIRLNNILRAQKKPTLAKGLAGLNVVSWTSSWPQDAIVWSLLVSGKYEAPTSRGYLTDTLITECDDFFYMLAPWENIPIAPQLCDEFWLESEGGTYILPDIVGHKDVSLSSALLETNEEPVVAYSNYAMVKLVEDVFFKKACRVNFKSQSHNRLGSFFTLLSMLLAN